MRARLIVNPASGQDRALELLPLMNARLGTLVRDLDITITAERDDVSRTAMRAAAEACDALYIAGGDGTLNAALQGLVEADGLGHLTIGLIPFGTGNDFAKALDLGEDPEVALETLLDALTIEVDVGMLNTRPFVNISAGGFVADVTEAVTERLKDRAGKFAFVIGGARALLGSESFSARFVPIGVREGLTWNADLELQMFAVCNAPMIGGGYPIAPRALIDDGVFDVLLVQQMPTIEFLGILQKIAAGEYEEDPRIHSFRASAFELHLNRAIHVNVDGELLEAERCRYNLRHRAARFFCGARPRAMESPVALSSL